MTGNHAANKIPATIITGFLGSGKTSLIRRLVEQADVRLAFLINEFGTLGIDRDLLLGCGIEGCTEDDVVELANGCICCTVAEDFVPAIQKILARDQRPEHLIIETSGLALPKPLVQAFRWPEIADALSVDAVVTVVDGAALHDGRFAADEQAIALARQADDMLDHDTPIGELFADQLAAADLVVLNKADLLEEGDLAAVRARLEDHCPPGVRVVAARHADLPVSVVLGIGAESEKHIDSRHSHHDEAEDHHHDEFDSLSFAFPVDVNPEAVMARLPATIERFGLLRIKGFLYHPDKPRREVVQAVGRRIERHFDRPWGAGETPASRLVLIADHDADLNKARDALLNAEKTDHHGVG